MRPNYNEIDRDHRARLVRRAGARFALDRDAAEDIAQIALLKAWEALPAAEFGPSGLGVVSWLNVILDNAAKDYLRHNKRRPKIEFAKLPAAKYGEDGEVREEDRDARGIDAASFSVWERSGAGNSPIEVIDFKRAAAKLPKIQRDAVELKHAGYTYREIGAAQKCTPDAARDRVRRAHATLMECAA